MVDRFYHFITKKNRGTVMKRNKLTALAVSVVSVLGALCSCSEGYDKLLDKNDPVTVTVWHYYNGVQQTMFDEMVNEFNQTTGIRIYALCVS